MKNIVEFLKKEAEENPNKLFLVDGNMDNKSENLQQNVDERSLTFRETFEEALKIAEVLHEQKINQQPIMIKAERKSNTVVAMLGIIMSNNFYVPVNPDYSADKINSIIQSSSIEYELCFNQSDTNLKHIMFDDCLKKDVSKNLYDLLSQDFSENNSIYTIYTSGSTGKPKGVLKTHKNMIAFVNNFLETFDLKHGKHIANQAPLFFDASMKDLYLSLALGATLFFPNKSLFSVPLKLIEYLNDNKINYIFWVPSALTIIVRLKTLLYATPKFLEYVFFVGEVFLPKYINMWLTQLPEVKYVNLYGSTELAGVCLYKVINKLLPEDKPIPLGKPIKNNNVFLSDGELIVESDQIASCYVNDEEKNQQVFVCDGSKRFLKTGDYAFIDENEDFVFTTRKDFQIKHMGYRIELQEIEIAISSISYITSCVVLFNKDKDSLVCFASVQTQIENPVKNLVVDLKQKLPVYMVPNQYQILQELPLNANGKIDRVKLKELIK